MEIWRGSRGSKREVRSSISQGEKDSSRDRDRQWTTAEEKKKIAEKNRGRSKKRSKQRKGDSINGIEGSCDWRSEEGAEAAKREVRSRG